ncbi:CCR4-NOT transcription complex subunit 3 isoform X2 [Anthonomus grandis grandis]|uniref:CCR4-NOT transcription complex subunit 3 isoform X2 n=1 Tax=Anthonomus grandis grandis TaxID=2921223 RepID=UPI0021665856|nr:CCR4-NOT transcription complex subunit 3 isoform X2 [Anthonomus grandis grandis]
MAASRKLQGEIDRCLKKVTEGVDTFEDIWQKVHTAANSNQKEKYEGDLKKEIKKLQRLRDQIKSWIASGEIKDKSVLMENRKLIETQMERFKVVERETKTKAYSKEGLGGAQKIDPAQKEKEEMQHWLSTSIDELSIQTDSFESEIEQLLSKGKKKLDKDKQERMEELKSRLERHRFHIQKLEALLRMLDNESVEVKQIKPIKDNVDYYIEAWKDPDFEDNEFIYDDIIGLDEVELSGVGLPSSVTTDSIDTAGTPTSVISGSSPVATSPAPLIASNGGGAVAAPIPLNHSTDLIFLPEEKKAVQKEVQPPQSKPVKPTAVRASVLSLNTSVNSVLNYSSASAASTPAGKTIAASSTPNKPTVTPAAREPSPVMTNMTTIGNFAAVAANNLNKTVNTSTEAPPAPTQQQQTAPCPAPTAPKPSNDVAPTTENILNQTTHLLNSVTAPPQQVPTVPENVQTIPNGSVDEKISEGMSTLKTMAQQVIDRAGLDSQPQHQPQVILEPPRSQNQAKTEAHIPPLLGVAPLGAVPLQKEHQLQFQLMEAAYFHMPHPSDTERIRTYLARNPCNTPSYYIQTPLFNSDTPEFYQRLGTETLFFVFYYMEGTKAQYLAAKALKKQSWRFHTKYMMWFQRHEEPKIINEEYEQGTYIYFDYEKWGQRKKEGFTFEYKYLEDKDLN